MRNKLIKLDINSQVIEKLNRNGFEQNLYSGWQAPIIYTGRCVSLYLPNVLLFDSVVVLEDDWVAKRRVVRG